MGVKLELYNDLVARINDKIPEYLTVRKWNNQVENEANESTWEYPACFIGFSAIDWEPPMNRTANVKQLQAAQSGLITITCYLVFEDKQEETAAFTDYEPLIQKIWYYLQDYNVLNSNWSDLRRVAEREDNNHNNVIVWQVDFQCAVYDYAACDLTMVDAAPVDLVITPSVFIEATTETNMRTDSDFS